jgi:hypothetical protein
MVLPLSVVIIINNNNLRFAMCIWALFLQQVLLMHAEREIVARKHRKDLISAHYACLWIVVGIGYL